MRKDCLILHINDGAAKELENGNWHYMEEFEWAERQIQEYLDLGYEVKQMIPSLTPARLDPSAKGGVAFYDTGFVVYLERQREDEELELIG